MGNPSTEATVGKWFKQAGDAVAADEPLVELETDKVTVEVPAPTSGVLSAIMVKEGDTVAVGAVLGAIGEGDGKAKPAPGQGRDGRAAARAAARRAPAEAPEPPKMQPAALEREPMRREEVERQRQWQRRGSGEMPPSPAARKYLAEAELSPAASWARAVAARC